MELEKNEKHGRERERYRREGERTTGALVLEVPGPNGAERAEALKEKMAEALRSMEGVRVARPVKMADLRVKDLVESITKEEVKETLAAMGGCKESEVKTGAIRRAPNGMGTLWVQCPLTAANRIAAAGRARFGWFDSRIEMLEPRQLQCFKCLRRGHVQSTCPSDDSRGSLCYRCSQEGHTAGVCSNRPHCVLCREQGLASAHRIGGAACKAPKTSAKSKSGGKDKRSSEDRMEVEVESQPAVRGGSPRSADEGAPVPVRLVDKEGNEEEAMEVETDPAPSQPPPEKRSPRKLKGREEPSKAPPSPQ